MSSEIIRERDRIRKSLSLEALAERNRRSLARIRQWAVDNPEKRAAASRRRSRERLPEKLIYNRLRRIALKSAAYRKLGGACALCGESEWSLLTVDHTDGDGAQHRKERGYVIGYTLYKLVVSGGAGRNLRLLCWSCNAVLGVHRFHPATAIRTLYCGVSDV